MPQIAIVHDCTEPLHAQMLLCQDNVFRSFTSSGFGKEDTLTYKNGIWAFKRLKKVRNDLPNAAVRVIWTSPDSETQSIHYIRKSGLRIDD